MHTIQKTPLQKQMEDALRYAVTQVIRAEAFSGKVSFAARLRQRYENDKLHVQNRAHPLFDHQEVVRITINRINREAAEAEIANDRREALEAEAWSKTRIHPHFKPVNAA